MTPKTAAVGFGALWLGSGVYLAAKSITLGMGALQAASGPLLTAGAALGIATPYLVALGVGTALILAALKSLGVLRPRAANRMAALQSMGNEVSWKQAVLPHLPLIAMMGGLAATMRLLAPLDVRAVVLAGIGLALMDAGLWVLRQAGRWELPAPPSAPFPSLSPGV